MPAELSIVDGKAEMAYLESDGDCWHGYGQALKEGADRSEWGQATNLDNWNIKSSPTLFYDDEENKVFAFPKEKILYRSDNFVPLSSVGVGYQIVQPKEVLDFFNNLVESLGFKLCTAGALFGGKKYWAQAYMGTVLDVGGGDAIRDKLLISTSCDTSLATGIQRVSERVVCSNTLRAALDEQGTKYKVTHSVQFDPDEAKKALGMDPKLFTQWAELARGMASKRISDVDTLDYFGRVFDLYEEMEEVKGQESIEDQVSRVALTENNQARNSCFALFSGQGLGSNFLTAKGTLWGALNAVTEYVDHRRKTRTADARIDSAYFGQFAKVKDKAWDEAVLMVR